MRQFLRSLAALVLLVAVVVLSLVAIGLREAVSDPIERRTEIAASTFPAGTPPYRVALLSDIHLGNRAMDSSRLESIVASINAARPDLVVIVGDFVNGHNGKLETRTQDLVKPLAGLKARDGVIATPGNHDHWTDRARIEAALAEAGIATLANSAVRRGPLLILGIDDGYTHHADIAGTIASAKGLGGVPVAVSHSPDIAPSLPPEVTTMLAGHTHCGQVVLPGIGSLAPLFGYHVYNPYYQCGVVHDSRRTVVVTAGLGSGSIPLRIGAPPDWWLVTFRAPDPPQR